MDKKKKISTTFKTQAETEKDVGISLLVAKC